MMSVPVRKLWTVLCVLGVAAGMRTACAYDWYTWSGNGHMYAVIEEQRTWAEQQAIAEGQNGYLVSILTPEEQNFLGETFGWSTHYWIGFYQPEGAPEPGGDWQWSSGEAFRYVNWASGEPNDQGNEDYGIMNWGAGGAWCDGRGHTHFSGIMEREEAGDEVPEVGTWVLVLCTGAAIGVRRRRKRQQTPANNSQ